MQLSNGQLQFENPHTSSVLLVSREKCFWKNSLATIEFSLAELELVIKKAKRERVRCKKEIPTSQVFGCADENAKWITLFCGEGRIKLPCYEANRLLQWIQEN